MDVLTYLPTRLEFETFRPIDQFGQRGLQSEQPSCFNGRVSIRKYRVVVEVIDEPDEIMIARLRKLWIECDNMHQWQPLRAAAKRLGVELKFSEMRKTKS